MAAKQTRAGIALGKDFYLCPLSAVQMPPEEITKRLQPVLEGRQTLEEVHHTDEKGKSRLLAVGLETTTSQQEGAFVGKSAVSCSEERLLPKPPSVP